MIYTDEQKEFITYNKDKRDISLIACPGSGKSTCILERINFLGNPNRSMIISFSKLQCEDLKVKKKVMNIKGIHSNMIMTLHSLCGRLLAK